MSQKTNPLSLRLQKGNRHFSSPWFTDMFFSDTFQYELMIRKYIAFLLQETQYSIAFFSAKKHYRKLNIALSIQDIRAERKEKQLLFNLKSSLSHKKPVSDNHFSTKSFSMVSTKRPTSLFRKRVRNDLLKYKLNPIKTLDNHFTLSKVSIATPYFLPLLSLQHKGKDANANANVHTKQSFVDSIDIFKNRIKRGDLLTYCENIIKKEKIKEQKEEGFSTSLCFEPIRFVNTAQSVTALIDRIVGLLEKRVSFKDIKAKAFKDVENNRFIKGVRFTCSGRLGGRSKKAQKAKMQSYQWGETTLNAFSSNVVFASKSATTPYGKVGVKIWLSFTL